MPISLRAAAISMSVCLASCALHPLPEDVTGVSTYHIVRQIRCEAREAIISSAIGWLSTNNDPEAQRIGLEFANHTRPIETFHYDLFKGRVRLIIKLFYDTGIAYNYSLQMTETNNLDTQIDLLKPFINSKQMLGITGNFDRQRQNLRTFTVTDTFSHLIRDVHENYCNGYIVQENYVYPIVGKIGMERVIQEFIRLTLFGNLSGDEKNGKGPPTLVDALDFETTVTASATPKVVFSPVGNALGVADASLTGTVIRKDVHKVTVGLAIPDASVSQVGPLRSTLFAPLLTASGGRSEQAAAAAVNQVLTLQIFQPTISVTQ